MHPHPSPSFTLHTSQVLQGLQGLQLDVRDMASKGAFEVVLRGQFRIRAQLPTQGGEGEVEGGTELQRTVEGCSVDVEMEPTFRSGGRSPCTEALLQLIGKKMGTEISGDVPGVQMLDQVAPSPLINRPLLLCRLDLPRTHTGRSPVARRPARRPRGRARAAQPPVFLAVPDG